MKVKAAGDFHMLRKHADARDGSARDPAALHLQCRAYWALRDLPKALECTNRFLAAAPNHPFGYNQKAMILLEERKPREAYDFLISIIDKFPKDAEIHYTLAYAAAMCGLKSEASRWLYVAISCFPALKQAALNLEAFADIKDEIERMNPEQ
jgi:predicted Zn-dependent protease